MHLLPRETEKLLLHLAGELAKKRKARGLKLNSPGIIISILTVIESGYEQSPVLCRRGRLPRSAHRESFQVHPP